MPELPEVETIRLSLAKILTGQIITEFVILDSWLRKPIPPELARSVTGKKIKRLQRRGKYLIIAMTDGPEWYIHLGMTGKLLSQSIDKKFFSHEKFFISTNQGRKVTLCDTRRFSSTGFWDEALDRRLGPEPLTAAFNEKYLKTRLLGRTRNIKELLLDQSLVAGLGNIYVSEALFLAQIHPLKSGQSLNSKQIIKLITAIKKILRLAIYHKGSSIIDYIDSDGKKGRFQERFKVYARENFPCRVCHAQIKRITQGSRSTFFCPKCQKSPKGIQRILRS
jgi:formamidopyrimidine-DNA glycosylase